MIDQYIRTSSSSTAFKWIKRLSILNPLKRDGSIVSCQLDEENDEMIVTPATHILVSGKSESPPISSFPNLPPVTEEELSEMQDWMSMNKGVTFDGFSDNWFKSSN